MKSVFLQAGTVLLVTMPLHDRNDRNPNSDGAAETFFQCVMPELVGFAHSHSSWLSVIATATPTDTEDRLLQKPGDYDLLWTASLHVPPLRLSLVATLIKSALLRPWLLPQMAHPCI